LRVGAGAGAAWEPSQKPCGFFVLPQPQRLPPAGEGEEALDIGAKGSRFAAPRKPGTGGALAWVARARRGVGATFTVQDDSSFKSGSLR
jgi:hypothetical protein